MIINHFLQGGNVCWIEIICFVHEGHLNFDIDILEMHHREKVDAPSGTALVMGKAAAKGRGQDFDGVKNLSREPAQIPSS